MMQPKNEDFENLQGTELDKIVLRQKSMNEKFLSLPQSEQEAVTNFFHLHNAAIWIYNFLTDEAKSYVEFCIQMTTEGNNIEKDEGALVS